MHYSQKRGAPYIKRYRLRSSVEIWIVDGEYIRNNIDVDFCLGQFDVKSNEIWIDAGQEGIIYSVLHELCERTLIIHKQIPFSKAHKLALAAEKTARTFPELCPIMIKYFASLQ